jgi:uncharacterized protein YkwD
LRSTSNLRAAVRASYPTFGATLRKHRAITRLSLAGLAFAVALGVSLQDAAAGPQPARTAPLSILPVDAGSGILTTHPVTFAFDQPMDPASVEDNLRVLPDTPVRLYWDANHTRLVLRPEPRWRTDSRYVIAVAGAARTAGGSPINGAREASFTTQTAPSVADFRVHLVEDTARAGGKVKRSDAVQSFATLARSIPFGEEGLGHAPLIDAPEDTAVDASSTTGIRIGFSADMNRSDVESRFRIRPKVRGAFSWNENELVFTPGERLAAGKRYAVSVVGAHDTQGNALRGDVAFSFTTRSDAELVSFTPDRHATGVTARQVVIRFSEPMNAYRTGTSLRITDVDAGSRLGGKVRWNDRHTRLKFLFNRTLPRGHTIQVELKRSARDMDGNRLSIRWRFETKAPRVAPAAAGTSAPPSGPAPRTGGSNAPAGTLEYALWLINQSRADYGFGPLRLDSAISQVAADHAWDQIRYNYFSHTGRDGSRVSDRLRRAGISFGWSGENMCYYNGMGVRAMLDWCHRTFMSEPYPGVANHIGNILSGHYTRVGVGIAQSGGKVIIVWDFAG